MGGCAAWYSRPLRVESVPRFYRLNLCFFETGVIGGDLGRWIHLINQAPEFIRKNQKTHKDTKVRTPETKEYKERERETMTRAGATSE